MGAARNCPVNVSFNKATNVKPGTKLRVAAWNWSKESFPVQFQEVLDMPFQFARSFLGNPPTSRGRTQPESKFSWIKSRIRWQSMPSRLAACGQRASHAIGAVAFNRRVIRVPRSAYRLNGLNPRAVSAISSAIDACAPVAAGRLRFA